MQKIRNQARKPQIARKKITERKQTLIQENQRPQKGTIDTQNTYAQMVDQNKQVKTKDSEDNKILTETKKPRRGKEEDGRAKKNK